MLWALETTIHPQWGDNAFLEGHQGPWMWSASADQEDGHCCESDSSVFLNCTSQLYLEEGGSGLHLQIRRMTIAALLIQQPLQWPSLSDPATIVMTISGKARRTDQIFEVLVATFFGWIENPKPEKKKVWFAQCMRFVGKHSKKIILKSLWPLSLNQASINMIMQSPWFQMSKSNHLTNASLFSWEM